MLAPIRRAAPVTSAALPVSALPAVAAPAGGSGMSCSMGDEYERIRVTLNPPAAVGRGRAPQPRARCAHARRARLRRRLAVVRALHGARSLHARPRVLQRGQRQDRPGRGLRDRSRGVGSVRPLPGAPVRGDSRAHRRGDSRARGRHRADGRGTSRPALRLGPWIASLGECLGRGVLLLADYGLPRRHYYHPERAGGTLRCHFKQRAHDDPYINLGVQDITAWVDFTRVAEAAAAADLTVGGFATQAAFLLAAGLEELVAQAADAAERARLAGEARRLIMPEEMGEAFKFMALTRGYDAPLSGFGLQDLSRLL